MDVSGKRVLIRVDYNVPYDKNMKITDDTRITATIDTLNYCIERGAKVILVSHLGRPDGKVVPGMSLKPVAEKLSELMKKKILFIDAEPGDKAKAMSDTMMNGDIALLENIRFYPGEEKNDDAFGKKLALLADVYINDAFATAHRGHASNDAITKYVKDCGAGFLMKNEIEYFKKAMDNPARPMGAIIGGAKVSSKLGILKNIIGKVDFIIIGGGMAFTFYKAMGLNTGKSLMEKDLVKEAGEILRQAKISGIEILLPVDVVVASEFKDDSPKSIIPFDKIPDDKIGLDIGPESIKQFSDKIKNSKTIVWNGPMGAFEMPNFSIGTNSIAMAVAESECLSIVGGGDSVTAINQLGISDKMSYISTAGGAFLELLEGKILPAVKALDK